MYFIAKGRRKHARLIPLIFLIVLIKQFCNGPPSLVCMRTRIATGPPLSADDPHTWLVRHGASLATFFRHEVCVVRVCTCVGRGGGGVSVRLTGRERSSAFRRPSACGRCEQGCLVWVRSDLHILALFFLSRLFHNVFAYGMLEIDKISTHLSASPLCMW
jgi:hypothetical protein